MDTHMSFCNFQWSHDEGESAPGFCRRRTSRKNAKRLILSFLGICLRHFAFRKCKISTMGFPGRENGCGASLLRRADQYERSPENRMIITCFAYFFPGQFQRLQFVLSFFNVHEEAFHEIYRETLCQTINSSRRSFNHAQVFALVFRSFCNIQVLQSTK
jgi:hypothetical protein